MNYNLTAIDGRADILEMYEKFKFKRELIMIKNKDSYHRDSNKFIILRYEKLRLRLEIARMK